MQTPAWDPNDTFDLYTQRGNPLPNPDVYNSTSSASYTGYNPDPSGPDYGLLVMLLNASGLTEEAEMEKKRAEKMDRFDQENLKRLATEMGL